MADSTAERSLERSLVRRKDAYAQEIRTVVEAAFRVMASSGGCDPGRDALALYDLVLGWMLRGLQDKTPPSRADAESLVRFAMTGLRRGA